MSAVPPSWHNLQLGRKAQFVNSPLGRRRRVECTFNVLHFGCWGLAAEGLLSLSPDSEHWQGTSIPWVPEGHRQQKWTQQIMAALENLQHCRGKLSQDESKYQAHVFPLGRKREEWCMGKMFWFLQVLPQGLISVWCGVLMEQVPWIPRGCGELSGLRQSQSRHR